MRGGYRHDGHEPMLKLQWAPQQLRHALESNPLG